jgi:hypothetical protein
MSTSPPSRARFHENQWNADLIWSFSLLMGGVLLLLMMAVPVGS